MKVSSYLFLVLCTAGVTNLGRAADPAKFVLPDPVAVVEGKEIKAADVQEVLTNLMERDGKKDADIPDEQKLHAARQIVHSLIIQQLIKTRSADTKIDDAEIDARFKQISSQPGFEEKLKANNMTADKLKDQLRESERGQKWIESQLGGKPQPTDAEIKEFYDGHSSAFDLPETIRVSHIFIKVPDDAKPEAVAEKQKAIDAAAKRIAKGEDFAKVAADVSEDPGSKTKGGDLNYLARKAMPPEFADAAFTLKNDEVSKVVKTQAGFHIIKATGRKEAHKVSFEEAKPDLKTYLGQQKEKQVMVKFVSDIEAKADIKNNLPPEPATAPVPSFAPMAPASAPAKSAPQTESKK